MHVLSAHKEAAGTLLLCLVLGYLCGRIADVRMHGAVQPLTIVPDVRPSMPVVRIDGIRNGSMEGVILGDARVFLAGEQVLPIASGSFAMPAENFLRNEVTVVVPEGMYFVASRQGKKYYPVSSASGERIAPQNRVYFRTDTDAKAAGYVE